MDNIPKLDSIIARIQYTAGLQNGTHYVRNSLYDSVGYGKTHSEAVADFKNKVKHELTRSIKKFLKVIR